MTTKKPGAKPNLRVVGGKSGGDSGGAPPANPRHMSVNALASLLGRDRSTVMRWIRDDCPTVQRADKATKKDWLLDVALVVRWLEEQASNKASADMADDEPDGEEDAKELIRLATMQLKLDELRRTVVKHVHATATIERHHGVVRQNVKALPLRIMDLMPGLPKEEYDRLYPKIVDAAYDCLRDAAKEIGLNTDTGKLNGSLPST